MSSSQHISQHQVKRAPEIFPRLALRIHGDKNNQNIYVEYAPITQHNGHNYYIGTYAPAPEEVLRNLGQALYQKKATTLPAYTGTQPDKVLFYGPDNFGKANMLLVTPASVRYSEFSTKNLVGVLEADLPMPRCVLQIRNSRLHLFALKGTEPVTDATPLYIPPTLNVSIDGSVCLGSMVIPKGKDYKTVEKWAEALWDMFFLSKGSHEHGAGLQVIAGKSSLKELYQEFIKKKTKVFPEEVLLPVPEKCHYKTVGDLRAELIRLL